MTYKDNIEAIIEAEVQRRVSEIAQDLYRLNKVDWKQEPAELFKQLRGSRTMKEMSDLTGISVPYWNDIEKGRTVPSIPRLREVAERLGKRLAIVIYEKQVEYEPCPDCGFVECKCIGKAYKDLAERLFKK